MKANTLKGVFRHIDMSGNHPKGCWPWKLQSNDDGRPYFSVNRKKYLAYRLVWELVNGEELGKRLILHQCDNPICCNPAHLKAGSHQENMDEMKDRERHGLPHHTVRAIRKLISQGIPHQEIATLYGLGRSTVTEIGTGHNYSHVVELEDTETKE